MAYGIEAIKKLKTRKGEIRIDDDVIPIARLPIEHMTGFFELFGGVKEDDPSALFQKHKIKKLMEYIKISIVSANEGIDQGEVEEFIASNFLRILEPFMELNGGGISLDEVPDDVKKQLETIK